jgi:hypothetical protein
MFILSCCCPLCRVIPKTLMPSEVLKFFVPHFYCHAMVSMNVTLLFHRTSLDMTILCLIPVRLSIQRCVSIRSHMLMVEWCMSYGNRTKNVVYIAVLIVSCFTGDMFSDKIAPKE